jgi:hypothetical protein
MSEPLCTDADYDDEQDDCTKSDFMRISGNVFSNVPYKLTLFMFIVGMLIFSDLFIDGFLHGIPGAVGGECASSKGTIIQLLLFCLAHIMLDLMIKYEWI